MQKFQTSLIRVHFIKCVHKKDMILSWKKLFFFKIYFIFYCCCPHFPLITVPHEKTLFWENEKRRKSIHVHLLCPRHCARETRPHLLELHAGGEAGSKQVNTETPACQCGSEGSEGTWTVWGQRRMTHVGLCTGRLWRMRSRQLCE